MTRETINRSADRATAAVTDLLACQAMLVNLNSVNEKLIHASGRLAERLESVKR